MPAFIKPQRRIPFVPNGNGRSDRDNDISKIKYSINSLGFRGEKFKKAAPKKIYVFGCSNTFGIGLKQDDIWCNQLREQFAQHFRLTDVNLLNFGLPGASNAEIARLSVIQCSVMRPDLAVAMFSHQERDERILGNDIVEIGPWTTKLKFRTKEICDMSRAYFRCYSDELGAMNMVKHMVFVQSYLKSQDIEYILVSIAKPQGMSVPVRQLYKLLDQTKIIWLGNTLNKWAKNNPTMKTILETDRAADGIHIGPAIHKLAAGIIWRQFLRTTRQPNNP
jgi:hypothetical protein